MLYKEREKPRIRGKCSKIACNIIITRKPKRTNEPIYFLIFVDWQFCGDHQYGRTQWAQGVSVAFKNEHSGSGDDNTTYPAAVTIMLPYHAWCFERLDPNNNRTELSQKNIFWDLCVCTILLLFTIVLCDMGPEVKSSTTLQLLANWTIKRPPFLSPFRTPPAIHCLYNRLIAIHAILPPRILRPYLFVLIAHLSPHVAVLVQII
jgi:hypothetical protein